MPTVTHWDGVEWTVRTVGEIGGRSQNLGTAAGSVRTGLRRVQVAPGMRSTPPHEHGSEEEIFFVMSGSGVLWLDGATCTIAAGDCIGHPAREGAHTLRAGPEGLDVLAFGTREYVETCYHPHSNRIWLGGSTLPLPAYQDLWTWDAEAGPLEFAPPGERPSCVANVEHVVPYVGGEGDCMVSDRSLGDAIGSVRTGISHVRVEDGILAYPPHCHSAEEELFVVLKGEGMCELGDDRLPLLPGSVVARPAGTGVPHALRGGVGGMEYLAYGTRDPNDIAFFPRSNKIYLRGVKVIARVEKLEYWDGER
ncbi:MAG: hypothetical protein QOC59_1974 [Microbacteriaceae bacterium]|nr:hypothetical protein [Microbacteriaceae bacterium]